MITYPSTGLWAYTVYPGAHQVYLKVTNDYKKLGGLRLPSGVHNY